MNETWKERVLALKRFNTPTEVKEYVSLVEEAMNNCTLDAAQVLMQTFTDHEDHGVQESVVSVLQSAEPEIYLSALLDELPRLLVEAPEWATTLIAREVYYNPDLFISVALKKPSPIRLVIAQFLKSDAITELYPPAWDLATSLDSEHSQVLKEQILE